MVIADVRFTMHCSDLPFLIEPPSAPYSSFLSEKAGGDTGSLTIDLNFQTGLLPATANLTEVFDGKGSWSMFRKGEEYFLVLNPSLAGGPECIARFVPRFDKVVIHCGEADIVEAEGGRMLRSPFAYPLDQLLLMYVLAEREGILVHAAGVGISGKGYLLPGRSGAGKSTLVRCLGDNPRFDVYSDDRVAVRKIGKDFSMFGTPWPGEAGVALNKRSPLTALFFMSHGRETTIRGISRKAALERLLPVTSVPWYDRTMMGNILDVCDDLCSHVPAYELCFSPGAEVVRILEEFVPK